jgi:hypothetical protein
MAKNFVRFYDTVSLKAVEFDPQIRDFFATAPQASQRLRVKIAATHAGKITRNNGFYLPDRMRKAVPTWTDEFTKPVLRHHPEAGGGLFGGGSSPEEKDPIGRVVTASYVDISSDLRSGWDSLHDDARPLSDTLLDAFIEGDLAFSESCDIAGRYFIHDARLVEDPSYQGLGFIELVADITDASAIQKVLDKRYLTGSIGATTDKAVCSVCNQDWASDEEDQGQCDHRPGRVYDGKRAVLIAGNLNYEEYSFVNKPADVHSGVIEINVNGVTDTVRLGNDENSDRIPEVTLVINDSVLGEDNLMKLDTAMKLLSENDKFKDLFENPEESLKTLLATDEKLDEEGLLSLLDQELEKKLGRDKETWSGETGRTNDHVHTATVDKTGTGVTNKANDHSHRVRNSKILPSDGHVHSLEITDDIPSEDEDPIKKFWGDAYDEIAGEDEEGKEYATMIANAIQENPDDPDIQELKDKRLTAKERRALSSKTFCGPDRSYPVNDCGHAKAAMARAKQFSAGSSVLSCIRRKAKRLGCPFKDGDSTQENFDLEHFDRYSDDDLLRLAEGLGLAMKDRDMESADCEDIYNRLKELETENETLKEGSTSQVDALRTELQAAYKDIDSLQDYAAELSEKIRDSKQLRIIELTRLSGKELTKEDEEKLATDLKEKSTDDIDQILSDLAGKVDMGSIADRLNSGLSRIPTGTVGDPTLKQDNLTHDDTPKLSKQLLDEVRQQYMTLRFTRGQSVAIQYLNELKRQKKIPENLVLE